MENNKQYDELLIRYMAHEVNTGERKFVEEWIHESAENYRHFLGLKDVWQLSSVKNTLDYVLDEMDVDQKWSEFRQHIGSGDSEELQTQQQLPSVSEKKASVLAVLYKTVTAASIVLMLGLGWKFLVATNAEKPLVQKVSKDIDHLEFNVRRVMNNTGKEKRVQVFDGSLIVLAHNSEITYREPFLNKRDVFLLGKAYFKVAKDSTRPFTVITGDVSTTALGTAFTVTAFEKEKLIIVRLYEGKVVVKAAKMMNDVYLIPGQEFIYDRNPNTKVKTFKMGRIAAPEQILHQESLRDSPEIPKDDAGSWYMFNNQQLSQVLDQLSALYNVQIIYNKRDVQNIYFTSKYNRNESLETILQRIGLLNKLTIAKKDTAFIISR